MAEISAKLVKELRDMTGAGMMDCKKALNETKGDKDKAVEWLRQKGIASAEKKSGRAAAEGAIGSYIHTGARVGVLVEVNCETDFVARGDIFQELVRNVAMQVAACPNVDFVKVDDIPAEVAEREKQIEMGRDDLAGKKEEMKEKIVAGRIGKRLKEMSLLDQPYIKDSGMTVDQLVKELRDMTGAGMMDCKKALNETNGDKDKAVEWLRQKGIASAEKKAGRAAAEGAIGSYIHTGARVGVLVEVNCETDFVARGEIFQELVRNVAMQVAACPNVDYVKVEDIPAEVAEREKQIEMGRDDLAGKKEEMKEKIVAGRIGKRLKEMSLLDQAYIKDSAMTVDELVKQVSGKVGENIQVRRFVRFNLGEGIEIEKMDFAAEVAAMQAA